MRQQRRWSPCERLSRLWRAAPTARTWESDEHRIRVWPGPWLNARCRGI